MTEIEQKALALVRDVADGYEDVSIHHVHNAKALRSALCRAIEQHEQFKREVSDAVEDYLYCCKSSGHTITVYAPFIDFILPKPVDPLVAVMDDFMSMDGGCLAECVEQLRAALAKRGLEVREIEG